MEIRKYSIENDEENLMALLRNEGEEWSCYWKEDQHLKYRAALSRSITYVAYENDVLCGYSRSLDDCGFYLYVCDLLVRKESRGKDYGRKLMECLYRDYPSQIVFVMSDVDAYYQKQGYHREGSVFEVHNPFIKD
jgi:GNAT superfamily N-acetyltransferase